MRKLIILFLILAFSFELWADDQGSGPQILIESMLKNHPELLKITETRKALLAEYRISKLKIDAAIGFVYSIRN